MIKALFKRLFFVILFILFTLAILSSRAVLGTLGRTQLEFDIHQNQELILFSTYAEPPQFAIWLENPKTGQRKTLFVTHRSAKGEWDGKTECPGSLPLWFEVFKREYQVSSLPDSNHIAPVAVTGATPQADHFKIRAEVPVGSEWICWIEVNLAGDYNLHYDSMGDNPLAIIDETGQPSIVYKMHVVSNEGAVLKPEIVGWVDMTNSFEEMIQPMDENITTAKDIFVDIKISVIRPKPSLFSWSYKHRKPQ